VTVASAPNDERFLGAVRAEAGNKPHIGLVANWMAGLAGK
jgi:hypothetical protein